MKELEMKKFVHNFMKQLFYETLKHKLIKWMNETMIKIIKFCFWYDLNLNILIFYYKEMCFKKSYIRLCESGSNNKLYESL